MSLRSMIKKSCGGSNNTSSKRIIMYGFTAVAMFMVFIQAIFTCNLIYRWAHAVADAKGIIPKFEVYSVFPDIIWYCVFGLIGGLAGINGIKDGFGKQKPAISNDIDPSDMPD